MKKISKIVILIVKFSTALELLNEIIIEEDRIEECFFSKNLIK